MNALKQKLDSQPKDSPKDSPKDMDAKDMKLKWARSDYEVLQLRLASLDKYLE